MNKISLKYKFLSLIVFLFICSFSSLFYIFYDFQKQKLNSAKTEQIIKIENSFYKNIEKHLKDYSYELSNKILEDPKVIIAVKEQNKDKLEQLTVDKYNIFLTKDPYIRQMNFFFKDGTNLLRLHKLDLSGDNILEKRYMLQEVFTKKVTLTGFEIGTTGLSYRVIVPLFDENRDFIGAFEIGISLRKILDTITFFNNIQGVFYADQINQIITSSSFIDFNFLEYIQDFKYEKSTKDIVYDKKHLTLQFFNINSFNNEFLGSFIFLHDLTSYYTDFENTLKKLFLISLITILCIFLLILYVFNTFYTQISIQKNRAEKILNSSNSIVIVTNTGRELIQVNNTFLNFFNFKSIEEFKKHYRCICDHFINETGFLQEKIEEETWVEYILNNPQKTHLAKIKKDDKFHIFKVFVNLGEDKVFNKNEFVSTFEDITYELDNEDLLKKSLSYNKALFDNTPVAIFLASSDRVILDTNKTACDIFGYKKDELLNKSFEMIHISKEYFKNFSFEYKKFENSILTNFEFPFIHKNGKIIWCSIFGTPLKNNDLSKGIIWTLLDITEKKFSEEALLKERNLFSSGPVIIIEWEFNEFWPIKYISSNCETVLGYTKDELLSKDFKYSSLIHKDDLQRIIEEVNLYTKQKNTYEQSYRIKLKNGDYRWFYDSNHVIRNSSGEIESIIGYMFDQTQLKESENILLKINEELKIQTQISQKANESKNQFLANMSHEMRTPMNAVIGLSELMFDTQLDEKQYDIVSKINTSSKMLLGIISDILDFSKIETGNFNLEMKAFSLDSILSQLKIIFAQSATNKNLELYFFNKSGTPKVIISDELRILQVLTNFLSNALKFTKEGNITLTIELIKKISISSAKIKFSIKDSGIGMGDEEVLNLFKPFEQADNSITRKYGGTGLGLTISQRIIESLGSKIEVISKKNKGTEFSFILEVETLAWDQKCQLNDKKFKILVVDDQEISRIILKDMLESFGYITLEAKDGIEAIKMVKKADFENIPFDFIIMDWNMPRLDGKETIKKIYELYENKKIQKTIPSILMVSAYSKDDINLDDITIDSFLSKPITNSTLFDALAKIKKGIVKKVNLVDNSKECPNLFGLKILLVEDNEINQEVASMFLQKAGIKVTIAKNGLEAVTEYKKNKGKYDLILMDLQMPILSGYDATKQIRAFDKEIPIVALTAAAMIEDKEKVISSGMNDHLGKPINSDELYNTIIKYTKKITEKTFINTKPKRSSNITLDIELLERTFSSKELINKLLTKFLEQLNEEFIDIVKRVKQNDKKAPNMIHGLKGVSGNLGVTALFTICQKIDSKYKNNSAITSLEIEILEEELAKIKAKLKTLNEKEKEILDENRTLLNNEDFKILISSIKKDLQEGSIVSKNSLDTLYINLKNILNNKEIEKLKENIDDFEYNEALDILNKVILD
ncbi:response regulator [Aliarcobacter lanthieri]|uniref:response regulator n=1 Tax=Aliarcobacter lanthieri TaxID=1355374 RepID=UPI003AAB21FE